MVPIGNDFMTPVQSLKLNINKSMSTLLIDKVVDMNIIKLTFNSSNMH